MSVPSAQLSQYQRHPNGDQLIAIPFKGIAFLAISYAAVVTR